MSFPLPTGLVCMALSFLAYPVAAALAPAAPPAPPAR